MQAAVDEAVLVERGYRGEARHRYCCYSSIPCSLLLRRAFEHLASCYSSIGAVLLTACCVVARLSTSLTLQRCLMFNQCASLTDSLLGVELELLRSP